MNAIAAALLLGGGLGSLMVVAALIALRRRMRDVEKRLLLLQQTDAERSFYERVRQDRSFLELLRTLLALNDLLHQPSGERPVGRRRSRGHAHES